MIKGKVSSAIMKVLAVLTVAALIYIAINTDFALILSHLRTIPGRLIALLLFLQILTQLSLNYQWHRLCKVLKLPAPFLRLLVVNSYGVVVDASNPGEKVGGEVARVVQLNNILGFNTNQSTSLVTIQKSLSLTALVALNIVAVIALSGRVEFLSLPYVRIILITILLFLAVFLVYALLFTQKLDARIQRIRSQGKIALWIKKWASDFSRDTKAISSRPREWLFQFLLSLAIWALFPVKLYIIVTQYAPVNLFVLFAVTFVAYFAAMIPLLPGGIGTFEAAMSGMLVAYSLSMEQAIAASLIFRFITFWFVVLISALIIILWKSYEKYSGRQRRICDDG
ncbi:MAG: lysylphosphatidylglycerol synthase transmembrane domain-containing protein [Christensenellales bacterium]|jgi:uncharacterized protein (TIRG00374 family)